MPKTLILDFETYYDKEYSLRKLSYPEYIRDDRFAVHLLGVDDGKRQRIIPAADIPKFLKSDLKDNIAVFHNAFFDAAVLAWRYDTRPKYMIDTLGLANHVLGPAKDGGGANDLASLGERLGLTTAKQDLKFMLGVRYPTPGQLGMLEEYLKADLTLGRGVLDKLLPQVSNKDFELWLLDHTLRIYTDKPMEVDVAKIKATKKLVEDRRKERVEASGVSNALLSSNTQFAVELKKRLVANKVKLPMKLSGPSKKDGKRKMIPALAKGDPSFLALAAHKIPDISNLVRGRLVERSATQAMSRLNTMEKLHASGIPVHLVYYGAHTGRFSGGGGFNFQNLTSPDRAVDPVDREIASSIRAAVVPGPGNVFVPVDAAQIEARVVAWLSGETQVLEAFASGADLYSQFISGVLKEDIHKPTDKDPKDTRQHLKLMRNVGKTAVLGLGFNMGVDKFMSKLKEIGAEKLGLPFAAEVVKGYREQYREIVNFWYNLNGMFNAAYHGEDGELGHLKFWRPEAGVVGITLPSNRVLYYRYVRTEAATGESVFTGMDGKQKTLKKRGRELKYGNGQKIYGGLLAENVTQAVARDILAEAIYASEAAGFPVALHVHDEIVVRVPQVRGQEAHDFLVKTLSTPPDWAPGLVLSAEGRVADNLGK